MCISSAGRNVKRKPCHGSSGLGKHGPAEISKKADRSRRQRLQLRKLFGNANSSITCCGLARATAKNGIMFVRIQYESDLSPPPMIGLTQARSSDSNSKRPFKNMPNRVVFRPITFPKSAPSSIQQELRDQGIACSRHSKTAWRCIAELVWLDLCPCPLSSRLQRYLSVKLRDTDLDCGTTFALPVGVAFRQILRFGRGPRRGQT